MVEHLRRSGWKVHGRLCCGESGMMEKWNPGNAEEILQLVGGSIVDSRLMVVNSDFASG